MITSEGYLFSKEAIMQYFLDQKKLKQQQLAEWEADQARLATQVPPSPSIVSCVLEHSGMATAPELTS